MAATTRTWERAFRIPEFSPSRSDPYLSRPSKFLSLALPGAQVVKCFRVLGVFWTSNQVPVASSRFHRFCHQPSPGESSRRATAAQIHTVSIWLESKARIYDILDTCWHV